MKHTFKNDDEGSSKYVKLDTFEDKSPNKDDKSYDVFVVKWADYSSKYGLVYFLSNGASGALFNDGSKII
jgi:hypothetical protein